MRIACLVAAGCGAPVYFPNEPPPRTAEDTSASVGLVAGSTGDTAASTTPPDTTPPTGPPTVSGLACSVSGGAAAGLEISDTGPDPLAVYWRDGYCVEWPMGTVYPGYGFDLSTYVGHAFAVRTLGGDLVASLVIDRDYTLWEVP